VIREPKLREIGNTGVKGVINDYKEAQEKMIKRLANISFHFFVSVSLDPHFLIAESVDWKENVLKNSNIS
jgi:hypothetical protein